MYLVSQQLIGVNLTTTANMDFQDAVIVNGTTILTGANITLDETLTGDGILGSVTALATANLTIDGLTSAFDVTTLTAGGTVTIFDVVGSGGGFGGNISRNWSECHLGRLFIHICHRPN